MPTAVAVITRNVRVHDNPVLTAALAAADRVVPLFVLDERITSSAYNAPNRARFLADALGDLHESLRERGGGLVVRRGRWVEEVARVAEETDAVEVHVASDVSGLTRTRLEQLRRDLGRRSLVVHESVVTVVEPGVVTPNGRDHFAVFTPYHRQWAERPLRAVHDAPQRLTLPRIRAGELPDGAEICRGATSPELAPGGETEGRRRMKRWLNDGIAGYADRQDELAADDTSRLSPYLHFGCLSPVELVQRATRDDSPGARAFVRQVAWRDFHHQVLAARPDAARHDYRSRGDRWRHDDQAFDAWKEGCTGYPIVDAGMRQLAREGWMHNRARLIVGSFLTKTLYVDWRLGAQHFLDLLVDGDLANNQMNWQWVAGTGTDTRPNRVLNPLRQAARLDPQGAYVRRYVPELAGLAVPEVHEPWRLDPQQRRAIDYPERLVDLSEAAERFRAARGR
ncbi:deoxyribodipyrimidine photo-lyase [Pseudonocardia ammonioxydans]|uniref:Deoxyribodipyrimidine photo-lyase n=1 Tax=Pseudonocardia ammonioxydans TaxID=260086 RepID=A0A1I4XNT1_PSUAM|nr:deoxyribodipyrimidine photo-lyase [Pseudonocardia ammonioxydans]SFN27491.1 deoxyribodipyrimidine photo-lyase [Pseudonocardia ammonioxydans]